jgi:hypothetical protein
MHPFFKHSIGILKDLWPQLLGLIVVIILFLWLLFAHVPQLRADFGFIEPQIWIQKSKAYIMSGFEPIGLPAQPKLEKRECSTEEGFCEPQKGINFE